MSLGTVLGSEALRRTGGMGAAERIPPGGAASNDEQKSGKAGSAGTDAGSKELPG